MAELKDIVHFIDSYLRVGAFKDFPGSYNGLQFQNSGRVTKIAAATDCGIEEVMAAKKIGADLLLVHHGMFWTPPIPVVKNSYKKIKTLIDSDIAVYSCHLPLDAHREIGNSALIAKSLGLEISGGCFNLEGEDIAVVAKTPKGGRAELAKRLKKLFPKTYKGFEFGAKNPKGIVICSGSGTTSILHLLSEGYDTLVCGELKQGQYVYAQENRINVYPCGHYATECCGIIALAKLVAKKFSLDYKFIKSENPL
ncbi:MAG: Nif3-like dinuclear metal center hexameric protein [Opitutales bacterium]|nr:Nif3-like dinuclear metal center hexameric protein [Opitutales bacterium]